MIRMNKKISKALTAIVLDWKVCHNRQVLVRAIERSTVNSINFGLIQRCREAFDRVEI